MTLQEATNEAVMYGIQRLERLYGDGGTVHVIDPRQQLVSVLMPTAEIPQVRRYRLVQYTLHYRKRQMRLNNIIERKMCRPGA